MRQLRLLRHRAATKSSEKVEGAMVRVLGQAGGGWGRHQGAPLLYLICPLLGFGVSLPAFLCELCCITAGGLHGGAQGCT